MMRQWSGDVILCTDGPTTISTEMQARLEQHGIAVRPKEIARLEGDNDGHLQRVCFTDGQVVERTGMFFTTGCLQRSDLCERLGCKRDEKGGIISDPLTEESSVPGVYVAGDASRDVLLIAVAIAEGAKAAVCYQSQSFEGRWIVLRQSTAVLQQLPHLPFSFSALNPRQIGR
jgi:thioredoxin reductase